MANYNLYKKIDTSSLKSASSSLKTKVEKTRTQLKTLKTSLNDNVWKASAKDTLFTAFDTMDNEVYKDIIDYLDKLDKIAGYIDNYKYALNDANTYRNYLNNSTKDTPKSSINSWSSCLSSAERRMEECERNIDSLL